MKVELVAKQFFKFGRKVLKPGEKFMATPAESRTLRALGRAIDPQPAAAPVIDKPKRAYKRRDMQAETISAPVPAMSTDTVPALGPVYTPRHEEVAPEPAPVRASLIDRVEAVREGFRAKFPPTPADASRETLHVTRPKKSAE